MHNSPSIDVVLPVRLCDIYDELGKVNTANPSKEKIQEASQFIRDKASEASLVALKQIGQMESKT